MGFGKLLKENLRWTLSKDYFYSLQAVPVSEETLTTLMQQSAEKLECTSARKIETGMTEFCLNSIALFNAKTPLQKQIKGLFDIYWQSYLRLSELFSRDYMLFPSDESCTRLEKIAELTVKCTQFFADPQPLERIKRNAVSFYRLNERETKHFDDVLALYKIKFFCLAAREAFSLAPSAEKRISALKDTDDLIRSSYRPNDFYSRSVYRGGCLFSAIDCLGNSSVFLDGKKTDIATAVKLFSDKRNVFDTFCNHKYGKKTACFNSSTKSFEIDMQYFVKGNCEIRRFRIENKGKSARRLTAEINFQALAADRHTAYFAADKTHCLGLTGKNSLYVGLCVIKDGKTLLTNASADGSLVSFSDRVEARGALYFDIATVYCRDMQSLGEAVKDLDTFGASKCPYVTDSAEDGNLYTEKLTVSPKSGLIKSERPPKSAVLDFAYQFGNSAVATFLDNDGNGATLLDGFAFGTGGENYYAISHGKAVKLNCGEFTVFQNGMRYEKNAGKTKCVAETAHFEGKTTRITLSEKARILAYFPLEEKSRVSFDGSSFRIESKSRSFSVAVYGKIESFTTSAVECNLDRLRYRLSADTESGTCLAVCLSPSDSAAIRIISSEDAFESRPLVKESLLSTYLNYINEKNLFCLQNRLKKADALTLAAICYTNAEYVKAYILRLSADANYIKNFETEYYDNGGRLKKYSDKMLLPLAALYYVSLTGDKSVLNDDVSSIIEKNLFRENVSDRSLCAKALALKKMSQLDGFDKVKALIEYSNAKKIITGDKELYKYAQAVGAVAFYNPSKQRLKDICNQFDLPRSWYYVSQLENLYGVNVNCGKLTVRPNVSAENTLEQFALYLSGKRIDTTFSKATVQSMSLNGIACFQGFEPAALKNDENTLVVKY